MRSAADLAAAVSLAVSRADLVVCSGGLGPTEDDLTVDVVSRLAGAPPVIDEPARARMEAWFQRAGTRVTDLQLRQVRVPGGARVHPNPAGLAPGFEVLLIDDLGYVQQSREEMEVLFTLLAERYERGSVWLTSNLPFSKWEQIFKDPMTTAAAIDRLVHHSVIVELNLPSYRLEQAKKSKETSGE